MAYSKKEISKIREKPGQSNAGKYPNVKKGNFAGPHGTYPINTLARARNALARAHFSDDPEAIKEKVYEKYPELKERHEEREPTSKSEHMKRLSHLYMRSK